MILQALYDYYEILAQIGEISKPGYGKSNVSLALKLSETGELQRVFSLKQPQTIGKKTIEVKPSFTVPLPFKKTSGIKSNFLCENAIYALGFDAKGKPEQAIKCFEAFKTFHHALLDEVDCPEANALLAFLDTWNPEEIYNCSILEDYIDELSGGANLVFCLGTLKYLHECPQILAAWDKYCQVPSDSPVMQCLVTGERAPAAKLHASIKGIKGGQSTGTSLVSFNAKAYESYGREDAQGLNSPVSEHAAFCYTTALNHLLANPKHKQSFGDTTMVFWAQSKQEIYTEALVASLNPKPDNDADKQVKETEDDLQAIFRQILRSEPIDMPEFNPATQFCILGLAPNAGRASVRFYWQDSFGKLMENISRHYQNLEIERTPRDKYEHLPLWILMNETVSPTSRDKASSPLLTGATLRAIFSGTDYPEALFNAVMVRIKAEKDINRGKAAIIKACLLRNTKDFREELTVGLNKESTNSAYVLGRLFAVLEKAQKDALGDINTTIKDRYFTSACATPANIFPILLRLSQHHISKAEYGQISNRRIQDLLEKLDIETAYPAHLSLQEQGIFILGYYHQQNENYKKFEKVEAE